MREIITKEQQKVIEKLANDGYADALIAYGADMYRNGMKDGAKSIIIGICGSMMLTAVIELVKMTKRKIKVDNIEE